MKLYIIRPSARGLPLSVGVLPVVRGVEHELEPAYVKSARYGTAGRLLLSTPVFVAAIALTQQFAPIDESLKLTLWVLLAVKLVFDVAKGYWWPKINYRHARYLVDDDGLRVRNGVLTRTVTSVPRSRVQHVDLAQNVWDRRFGLATLVVHTAASGISAVTLQGISRETAEHIRDFLMPQAADDAV